ncbi:hypothetical protein LIER_16084 [Lithospermum erythrorhizon]|uniref:Uncharacterized protein n=1 Tax=Lithospermum erythrorhizon TaxID=34254 RepID=A0AAV3Q6R9_LITER
METEEDGEVFAAEVGASSKVHAKKRKMPRDEEPKRKSKKTKVPTITEGAEGAEEAHVAEPGVKESQTLEGFRRNTAESIIEKGHLRHLRDHYSIHQKVLIRMPFEGETPAAPQGEGYILGVLKLWAAIKGLPICRLPPIFNWSSPWSVGALRLGHSDGLPDRVLNCGGCPQH